MSESVPDNLAQRIVQAAMVELQERAASQPSRQS